MSFVPTALLSCAVVTAMRYLPPILARSISASQHWLAVGLLLGWLAPSAVAQDADPPTTTRERARPTLGGVQLYTDELVFGEWRVQRQSLTGHCRLLDGDDRQHATGSFEACRDRLEVIKREQKLPPIRGRVVVLLHGLGGWRYHMQPIADSLGASGKYTPINMGYASTRADLGQHARALDSVIANLPDAEEIDFVAHSMGNLVVRYYLGDHTDEKRGLKPDPRIRRFVMLSPPNHGAELADGWGDNELFVGVLGAGAYQMGDGWKDVEKRLAVPACEFGIIASGKANNDGYTAKLPGDDDGVLTVATMRLAGANDWVQIPGWHPRVMRNPEVQQATLRYLEHGYFIAADKRQPIAAEPGQ